MNRSGKPGGGVPVTSQEVVHSTGTEEADCAEQSTSRRGRMDATGSLDCGSSFRFTGPFDFGRKRDGGQARKNGLRIFFDDYHVVVGGAEEAFGQGVFREREKAVVVSGDVEDRAGL